MAKVVFSPAAKADLLEAGDHIAFRLQNKIAARNLIRRIQKTVLTLEQFPDSGTPLECGAPQILYRYLLCGNYMIFYHLCKDTACIDRILYGRRDYLSILFGGELSEE